MLLDIIKIKIHQNFILELTFENNEIRFFDFKPFLKEKPFNSLNNEFIFKLARIENGTLVWPGEIDIAPETLYDLSVKDIHSLVAG